MKEKVDRRIIRTRTLLVNSLMSLIIETGYDQLTVRKIVERAQVNRSTFYLHFQDKYDILIYLENKILQQLNEALDYPSYTYKEALQQFTSHKQPIQSHIKLFTHIKQYEPLYKQLLKQHSFHNKFITAIKQKVMAYNNHTQNAIFMAHGATGIIQYWVERQCEESIEEMSLWLTKVMLFPLGKFSNDDE